MRWLGSRFPGNLALTSDGSVKPAAGSRKPRRLDAERLSLFFSLLIRQPDIRATGLGVAAREANVDRRFGLVNRHLLHNG